MRIAWALCLIWMSRAAFACGTPVCIVDPDTLGLVRIITFEETQSSMGPGTLVDDLLVLEGAAFGERFAGQSIEGTEPFDRVTGAALPPLTLMSGAAGQNLSVVHMMRNNVLNGYGPAGFPKRNAQGEGAIAVLFDSDQSALSFDLRGGEDGMAQVLFFRRDASLIAQMDLTHLGEHGIGFTRNGGFMDIAGFVLTNTDPQGLALDNLRFGLPPDLS